MTRTLAFAALLGMALPQGQAQEKQLGPATLGGGGGWSSAAGREALITLGQPVAGPSSGGRYRMDAGASVLSATSGGSSIFRNGFEE